MRCTLRGIIIGFIYRILPSDTTSFCLIASSVILGIGCWDVALVATTIFIITIIIAITITNTWVL